MKTTTQTATKVVAKTVTPVATKNVAPVYLLTVFLEAKAGKYGMGVQGFYATAKRHHKTSGVVFPRKPTECAKWLTMQPKEAMEKIADLFSRMNKGDGRAISGRADQQGLYDAFRALNGNEG